MDWFLYDNGLRHERVKSFIGIIRLKFEKTIIFGISTLENLDQKCFKWLQVDSNPQPLSS